MSESQVANEYGKIPHDPRVRCWSFYLQPHSQRPSSYALPKSEHHSIQRLEPSYFTLLFDRFKEKSNLVPGSKATGERPSLPSSVSVSLLPSFTLLHTFFPPRRFVRVRVLAPYQAVSRDLTLSLL